MRVVLTASLVAIIVITLVLLVHRNALVSYASLPPASNAKIDFATQIEPIFRNKCQPCHFNGGVVYERLPFDRPETIKKLGTRLFTRLKDENDQRLIRKFLDES